MEDAVEEAVDEAPGIFRSEAFRELDGLVDDHELRNILLVKELINGQAQDTDCRFLTFNSIGQRGARDSSNNPTTDVCW